MSFSLLGVLVSSEGLQLLRYDEEVEEQAIHSSSRTYAIICINNKELETPTWGHKQVATFEMQTRCC